MRKLLLVNISTLLVAYASGQTYSVQHGFNIAVNPSAGQQFQANWSWGLQAIARNRTNGNQVSNDYSNANFTNGGSGLRQVSASVNGANANSNAQFSLNSTGSGFHKTWGGAFFTNVNGRTATSYSASTLKARIGTYHVQGGLQWSPNWQTDSVFGSKSLVRDPVTVSMLDLVTNARRTSTLFDTTLEIDGAGTSTFADGLLQVDANDAYFRIQIGSDVMVNEGGFLEFRKVGGVVVESVGEGRWAGFEPSLGSSGPVALALSSNGDFDLSFDFQEQNGVGYMLDFDFSGGGESLVPEPGTILVLGLGAAYLLVARRRLKSN
ncbi:MAG TPA: PEP-CTERM sorting domain-containing protein [Fimbriimonadaceae bacterium]|nr:PEP-CTERM sorting domain-containing protein [Fimbriimonadaceae bacterium]